jgi:hypothetical protein
MMNEQQDFDPQEVQAIVNELKRADRFDNYREITAKFNSIGKCGHQITKGDRIGYNKRFGCQCSNCWSRWVAENREADAIEAGYMNSPW